MNKFRFLEHFKNQIALTWNSSCVEDFRQCFYVHDIVLSQSKYERRHINYQCLLNKICFQRSIRKEPFSPGRPILFCILHDHIMHGCFVCFHGHKIEQKILPGFAENKFVTRTDKAIEDRIVPSSLAMMSPAPCQRFALLKKRSTSIRSVLSWYSLRVIFFSFDGRPSFGPDRVMLFFLQKSRLARVRQIWSTRTRFGYCPVRSLQRSNTSTKMVLFRAKFHRGPHLFNVLLVNVQTLRSSLVLSGASLDNYCCSKIYICVFDKCSLKFASLLSSTKFKVTDE